MKQRCNYPKHNRYSRYGGRGIKVCDRWNSSFLSFLDDMGYKPSPLYSLDRIDNNGDYEPSNCRWVLPIDQANNVSNNVFVEYIGENLTIRQWSERTGIKYKTLRQRLFVYNWPIDKALTLTVREYKNG